MGESGLVSGSSTRTCGISIFDLRLGRKFASVGHRTSTPEAMQPSRGLCTQSCAPGSEDEPTISPSLASTLINPFSTFRLVNSCVSVAGWHRHLGTGVTTRDFVKSGKAGQYSFLAKVDSSKLCSAYQRMIKRSLRWSVASDMWLRFQSRGLKILEDFLESTPISKGLLWIFAIFVVFCVWGSLVYFC